MDLKHNFKLVNTLLLVEELIENEYLLISERYKTKDGDWVDEYSSAYITVLGYIRDIKVKDDVTKLYPAALTALRKVPVWSNTGKPLSPLERKQTYQPSPTGGLPVSLYDYLYTEVTISVSSKATHKPERPVNPFKYTNGYEVLLVMIDDKLKEFSSVKRVSFLNTEGESGEQSGFKYLQHLISKVEELSSETAVQTAITNLLKKTYVRSDNGVKLTKGELAYFHDNLRDKTFKLGSIYPVTQFSYMYENPTRYWEDD